MPRIIHIPYWISNNGDGSASVRVESTKEQAALNDDSQLCGWGEPTDGVLKVIIQDDGMVTCNGKEIPQ